MLNLICGTSGTGKTKRLIEQIRTDLENGIPCFLLVPEQQAYISERDFPALLPQNAALLFRILSFSGLANTVFRKYGGIAKATVGHGLRTLLMWESLRHLSAEKKLKQYGSSVGNDLSFSTMMLQTVTELRTNGISNETLKEAAKALPPDAPLQKKLSDIAAIDEEFHNKLQDCSVEDPADQLLKLVQKLKEHDFFRGCHVYLDSFAGFTQQEYAVLAEIIRQADNVTVTLCTDAIPSALPHFSGANQTADRLESIAKKATVPMGKQLLPKTEGSPRALRILEKDLWRFSVRKDDREELSAEEKDDVRLISCADAYEECEAAAWSILELVQNGMRYGEIAIVARDAESYRGVLDTALEKYGIPYFLSERTDLSSKPLSRLIISALHAVSHGYPVRDIMTLVKTGLAGVDIKDASLFEEYCETWHINYSRFTDPLWSMNPDGLTTERSSRADTILESANRTRKTVMEPLMKLTATMRAVHTVPARCRALYEYLQALNIPTRLSELAHRELLLGQKREASETLRLYQGVTNALATLAKTLPDTEISVDEFATALSIFFSETDMGSIPQTQDCVIIGSAPTLRVENVKASLLLGLCDGEFPRAASDDGILTESDKITLKDLGITLDSREETRSFEEMLYVYRAVSKPSRKLLLFTVSSSGTDSDRAPSLAFTRAKYLLQGDVEAFDSTRVKAYFDPNRSTAGTAAEERLPPMPKNTVLHMSQTKLKDFVLCPYSYYSTYVLKNRSVKDSALAYNDDGIFLHHIFECFLRESLNEDGTLSLPDESKIEELTDSIIHDYLHDVFPFPLSEMEPRQLHTFYRLRKFALKMLGEIINELKNSEFVPSRFEQDIGKASPSSLPAVEFPLRDGCKVLLSGTIDRVDLREIDGKMYVRVIDYKSGSSTQFSVKDVRSGMDMQLVLYLYALLASDPTLRAAGAQYLYAISKDKKVTVCRSGFFLDEETVKAAADSSANQSYLADLEMQSAKELEELQADMKNAVVSIGERILSGEAYKTPSEDACRFCSIKKNCDKAYQQKEGED